MNSGTTGCKNALSGFKSTANESVKLTNNEIKISSNSFYDKNAYNLLSNYAHDIADSLTKTNIQDYVQSCVENPQPGYVIKYWTKQNPSSPVFINICSDDHIPKPSFVKYNKLDQQGIMWTIPSLLLQSRKDYDVDGCEAKVFDVVFNHETLEIGSYYSEFKKLIEKSALKTVQSNVNMVLNAESVTYSELKYKGERGDRTKCDDSVTPKYKIRHRSEVSLQDFGRMPDSCSSTRPKELVFEIELPLIEKASELNLDVKQLKLKLETIDSKSYKLDVNLPFPVDENKGKAEFNKDNRTLSVILPVLNYDASDKLFICDNTTVVNNSYWLPPFEYHQTCENVIYILKVQNVSNDSLKYSIEPSKNGCDVQFSSVDTAFVPFFYSFCLRFGANQIDNLFVYMTSDNVVLKMEKSAKSLKMWETFHAGVNNAKLSERLFVTDKSAKEQINKNQASDEASLSTANAKVNKIVIPESVEELPEVEVEETTEKSNVKHTTIHGRFLSNQRKQRSMSESATDDMKINKRRGILKMARNPVSRTMSESSDETINSMDSMNDLHKCQSSPDIPEEGYSTEDVDKPKKHVRFMDKVSRNLYRSNSSILGQRKKNQKKNKSKKKGALKRSNSECSNSSCSEAEPTDHQNDNLPTFTYNKESSTHDSDATESSNGQWIQKKSKKNKRKNRKSNKNVQNDSGISSASEDMVNLDALAAEIDHL